MEEIEVQLVTKQALDHIIIDPWFSLSSCLPQK
jgi:hypothetical protein